MHGLDRAARAHAESRLPHVDQLHIGVMHEPGGVDGAVRRFAPQTLMRETTKLGVHQRDKPIERLFVSLTPLTEQERDV